MKLKHVGVRPTYPLVTKLRPEQKAREGIKYEIFAKGGYKIWTERMLRSGCNNEVSGDVRIGSLIYCEHCDEFFSQDQFVEGEGK